MKPLLAFCILQSIFLSSGLAQVKGYSPNDWEKIYNGRNLAGWLPKTQGLPPGENFKNTFQAKGAVLSADFREYVKFENKYSVLYFNRELTYYHLRLEYHFVGDQVPGSFKENDKRFAIMVHAQPANTLSRDQGIPVGLEINLLGVTEYSKDRHTGILCTPGTSVRYRDGAIVETACVQTNRKSPPNDEWVQFEIDVYGDSLIRHYINGRLALEYIKPKIAEPSKFKDLLLGDWGITKVNQPLKSGFVALLVESQSVELRNIELLDLRGCRNPRCPEFKAYHIKQLAGDCECTKAKEK